MSAEGVNNADIELDSSRWVELYGDYLFRYAYLRLHDREQAEDVVQETLLSAYAALDRFERKSTVRTWLISILRNKIIDHIRKGSREHSVSYDDSLGSDDPNTDTAVTDSFNQLGIWKKWYGAWDGTPEALVEQKHFMEKVQDCLMKLPENLRNVFMLRTLDSLSTEEICEKMTLSANNVWVILYRARLRLRECLDLNWFKAKE